MSKRARSGSNEAADRNADQDHTGRLQELAYEAVERALRARWIGVDWEMYTLIKELRACLEIPWQKCTDIWTKLKQELQVIGNDRAHNPPQDHVAQVQNTFEGKRANLPTRQLFTAQELQDKDEAAYEAVERAFRFQQNDFIYLLDAQTLGILDRLRDLLAISEELYDNILRKLEQECNIQEDVSVDIAQIGDPGEHNLDQPSGEANDDEDEPSDDGYDDGYSVGESYDDWKPDSE